MALLIITFNRVEKQHSQTSTIFCDIYHVFRMLRVGKVSLLDLNIDKTLDQKLHQICPLLS